MITGIPEKRQSIFLTLVFLCHIYFFQIYPTFVPTNELSRLLLVSAVVDDHTFAIDRAISRFGDSEDKAFFRGHSYSDKAVGVSLLGIVPYAVLRMAESAFHFHVSAAIALSWLHFFSITIPSILFLPVLSRYWQRMRPDTNLIPHFLFLLLFGTIAFTYSVQFINHYLLGVLLFSSIYWLDRYNGIPNERPSRNLLLAGAAAGLALTMEYPAVFPVALVGLYALWSVRKNILHIAWFVAPLSFFVLLMLAYNYSIFGTPFDVTYRHMTDRHIEHHARGIVGVRLPKAEAIWGLLFSRHHGLFFISPFLLFSIPGLFLLLRRKEWRVRAWLFAGICLSLLLIYAGFTYWIGGWAVGPRYLAPAMPFLMTAAYFFFTEPKIRKNSLLTLAGIVTGVVSILMVIIGTVTFPYPPDPIKDPHFFVFFPMVNHEGFGYNIGRLLGFTGLGTLLMFFTLLVITYLVAVAPAGPLIPPSSRTMKRWAAAAVAACVLITAAFLTSPERDAREYYARGLVYAFVGNYRQASIDMKTALVVNPDKDLEKRIQRTIVQLDRLIGQNQQSTE
jgi:hypothetical protein